MRISDWSSDVCSSDLPLWVEQRIEARDREAADLGRRLETARERLQIATRPADEIVPVVVNEARAAALEIGAAGPRLPIRFAFQHHPARARRAVEKGEDRKSTRLNSSH